MILFQKYRKPLIIVSIVLASIFILILILQLVVSNIITHKVENALANREGKKYNVKVGKAKVNLFTMTLILKDVEVIPDSNSINELKYSDVKHAHLFHFKIPNLRVRNVGIIGFLQNKFVEVGDFVLKEAIIDIYTDGKPAPSKVNESDEKQGYFNLDSIPIPGIGGSVIHNVHISNFGLNIINIITKDTMFATKRLSLLIDEISLSKNQNDSTSFTFKMRDLNISMIDERFLLPGGKYDFSFDKMNYDLVDSALVFNNISIDPRYSRAKMVSMSKFQQEIYNVDISKVEVKLSNLRHIILSRKIYLSNVFVDGLKVNIFKDKRLPFDESKRPKLPHQLLKDLKQDIYIDSINLVNSELVYSERHKLMEELMEVTLADLNVTCKNVTSVIDSIVNGTIMSIELRAKLQKQIPMKIDLVFPMKSVNDTFSFSGYLKSGNMKMFNSVVLPAIGVKFENGYLDRLDFHATANPTYSIGEMTMQYHELQGQVQKHDMVESKKFISWLANSVIIQNNPTKGNKPRTVPMYFDRVVYKGLGNYLWKTIQSGVLATIIPTVDNKVQNNIDTRLGVDAKTIRKREKEEKHRKREKKKNK